MQTGERQSVEPGVDDLPLISVIVATYNRAHLLPTALDSILKQSWSVFEVIVVDDGSTDNTVELVQGYSDPRVRLIQQDTNQGVGAAYNAGLHAARGSLLAIFDSDDRAESIWLERLANACLSSDDVGMAWGWIREHYTDGRPSAIMYRNPFHHQPPSLLPTMLTWTPGTLGLMFRRDVFEEIGEMDRAVGRIADLDFTIRFAVSGQWTIRMVPEVLLHKLAHGSNISIGDPGEDFRIHTYLVSKHREELLRYPCAYAQYLYTIGRNAASSGRADADSFLAEAVNACPTNYKYRLYLLARRANLSGGWQFLVRVSTARARLRGHYRDLMHRKVTRDQDS